MLLKELTTHKRHAKSLQNQQQEAAKNKQSFHPT